MGPVYDIILPDTIYTYEAVLGDIVTKLMLGFVSSAGTAHGAKQLVFPDVDFSPYSLQATLPLHEKHVMHLEQLVVPSNWSSLMSISALTVSNQLYLYKRNTLCTLYLPKCRPIL